MMEKDFDFGQVGKRMPFRTPDGFFERMQEEALQRVAAEKRKKKIYRLKVGFASVLGAAAMLCGAVFFLNAPQSEQDSFQTGNLMVEAECNDPFCLYLQQLSDEDLNSLADFMENDIFMYTDQ